MQTLVPLIAFLTAIGLTPSAFADPDLRSNLGDRCSAVYSDPGYNPEQLSCYDTAWGICRRIPSLSGCNKYGFPARVEPQDQVNLIPANSFSQAVAADFNDQNGKYKQLAKQAEDAMKEAKECCGNNSCLNKAHPDAITAHRDTETAHKEIEQTSGKNGDNKLQKTGQRGLRNSIKSNAGVAGVCRTNKQICAMQYSQLSQALQSAQCQDCSQNQVDLGRLKDDANKAADECAKMTSVGDTEAQKFAKQLDELDPEVPKTASRPGGSNGAGGGGNPTGDRNDRVANGSRGSAGGPGMGQMLGAMLPMMMQAMAGQQQQQQPPNQMMPQSAVGDCNTMGPDGLPVLAGCSLQKAGGDAWENSNGAAGMQTASVSGSGSNLSDSSLGVQPASVQAAGGAGTPITTKPVTNGGGGGIPGAGGSGGSASLGGSGGGGGGAGPQGKVTDILHGEGGGGGGGGLGKMNEAMNMQTGGSGGYTYGQGGSDFERIPLADFLPGGPKYQGAARGLAGMGVPGGMQIQSKSVNIWNRISDLIKARCAQGLLRDCGG